MKIGKIICGVAANLALLACGGGHQQAASSSKDTESSMTVCLGGTVPAGWVITAHENWPLCPGSSSSIDYRNAEVVEPAKDGLEVCDDSAIPAGFFKAAAVASIPCVMPIHSGFGYTNAHIIRKL